METFLNSKIPDAIIASRVPSGDVRCCLTVYKSAETMKYLIAAVVMSAVAVYSNVAFARNTEQPYSGISAGQIDYDGCVYGVRPCA